MADPRGQKVSRRQWNGIKDALKASIKGLEDAVRDKLPVDGYFAAFENTRRFIFGLATIYVSAGTMLRLARAAFTNDPGIQTLGAPGKLPAVIANMRKAGFDERDISQVYATIIRRYFSDTKYRKRITVRLNVYIAQNPFIYYLSTWGRADKIRDALLEVGDNRTVLDVVLDTIAGDGKLRYVSTQLGHYMHRMNHMAKEGNAIGLKHSMSFILHTALGFPLEFVNTQLRTVYTPEQLKNLMRSWFTQARKRVNVSVLGGSQHDPKAIILRGTDVSLGEYGGVLINYYYEGLPGINLAGLVAQVGTGIVSIGSKDSKFMYFTLIERHSKYLVANIVRRLGLKQMSSPLEQPREKTVMRYALTKNRH